jgi:hypothetical protein
MIKARPGRRDIRIITTTTHLILSGWLAEP